MVCKTEKKTDLGPVLGNGFTKVVRDSCIRKIDYLMFQSFGPSSFFLSVFKLFVHENCFISKITPEEDVIVMADEFWRQFYGKNFKGGQSTLYLVDRFYNVKMNGLTDSCVFTHGCSEMVNLTLYLGKISKVVNQPFFRFHCLLFMLMCIIL
ncbi:hypothetical protein HanPI659440_Chr07g0255911 [Helianthus annuus]|nr:hypothetical protein HanPI659440_Chr07g0255911 [Helianthus annuus]